MSKIKDEKKKRQIIIETDGANINIVKAEVSAIELVAICGMVENFIRENGRKVEEHT